MLERGDLAAAGGLPPAWLAKARTQLQECNESGALETAAQGVQSLLKQQASPVLNHIDDITVWGFRVKVWSKGPLSQ